MVELPPCEEHRHEAGDADNSRDRTNDDAHHSSGSERRTRGDRRGGQHRARDPSAREQRDILWGQHPRAGASEPGGRMRDEIGEELLRGQPREAQAEDGERGEAGRRNAEGGRRKRRPVAAWRGGRVGESDRYAEVRFAEIVQGRVHWRGYFQQAESREHFQRMQAETETPEQTQTKEEEQAEEEDEITRFIRETTRRISEIAAEMADPEDKPQQALSLAIAAWQLVRAICDKHGLAVVSKDGIICGLAKISQEDKTPEEI